MSVKVTTRVWANSRQSGGSLLVMLALADLANDEGECWPSIPVLAQKARLTDRQIWYLLPKLEEAGEIRIKRSNGGRNRRNHYLVTVSENPENISVKNIQGNSFSEICDTKTLKPISGALNRHRTVNKNSEPNGSSVLSHLKKKRTRGVAILPELQPAVSRVVARINELAGSHYRDDKPDALRNLIARLNEGRTERECLTVVEGRHVAWVGNDKMLEYFRPSTLFAAAHFEDYLQAAQRQGNGHVKPAQVKDLGNGMVDVDGVQMDRRTYKRRHGQHPN